MAPRKNAKHEVLVLISPNRFAMKVEKAANPIVRITVSNSAPCRIASKIIGNMSKPAAKSGKYRFTMDPMLA